MTPSRFAYGFLLVCSNAAACDLPTLAVIPKTIGDDVANVLVDVRRYSDATVAYTDCLKTELSAAGGDAAPASVRSVLIARNNRAVDEHKAITDLYAERVGPLANLRLAEFVAGESRDCLQGSMIERTGVVNDGAVIFFARGAAPPSPAHRSAAASAIWMTSSRTSRARRDEWSAATSGASSPCRKIKRCRYSPLSAAPELRRAKRARPTRSNPPEKGSTPFMVALKNAAQNPCRMCRAAR